MLTRTVLSLGSLRNAVCRQFRRNIGVTAPAAAQLDPIQQLFVDKIREYAKKSKWVYETTFIHVILKEGWVGYSSMVHQQWSRPLWGFQMGTAHIGTAHITAHIPSSNQLFLIMCSKNLQLWGVLIAIHHKLFDYSMFIQFENLLTFARVSCPTFLISILRWGHCCRRGLKFRKLFSTL